MGSSDFLLRDVTVGRCCFQSSGVGDGGYMVGGREIFGRVSYFCHKWGELWCVSW